MDGGCLCGRVRYRLEADPITVNACHCRDCQKITGSAFAVNAMVERDRVAVIAGVPAGADGEARCPACATLLWATHPMFGDAIVFLRAGTLDAGERLAPTGHFFLRSRHPWVVVPDGVPAWETLPEGDAFLGEAARARIAAARGG